MEVRRIETGKERYLPLLLLGDEQESMIGRYLERGELYVLLDGERTPALCVVTDEGDGVLELKNIAVAPEARRRGCGRYLIEFLRARYRGRFRVLQAGTGDSPLTVPFYEACGFRRSHVVEGFFLEHYDHPIYEAGVRLRDMIYFRTEL